MKVLVCVQDSQQLMQGHELLPAEEQRGRTEETHPALPRPGEVRVMAGGWAEPRLVPPCKTPGIAGIWGSHRPPSPECLRYGCYLILTYTW